MLQQMLTARVEGYDERKQALARILKLAEFGNIFNREEFNTGSVEQAVRDRYTQVAERGAADCCDSGSGDACCDSNGTTNTVAEVLYEAEDLDVLTPEAMAASAGCGNPIGLSDAQAGETVLDLGSGGGIDCFLAAERVGDSGHVIGIDMTHAMIDLARQNAEKLDADNVVFKLGKIEAIPQQDATVDLVISNCVIALSPDKDRVFDEIHRILKPGGRFVVSDMVVTEELPDEVRTSAEEWVSCVGGADLLSRYLSRMERSGFSDVEVVSDVPMRSRADGTDWEQSVRSVTVRGWRGSA